MADRINDFSILITAKEAYPRFEAAVMDAQRRVDMGFRVFDPETPLLSDRGCEVGKTWADLLVDALDRGVKLNIVWTDLDPVVRPKMHRDNWRACRVLKEAAERSKNADLLTAHVSAHPARTGWAPRALLWPKIRDEVRQVCDWLNAMEPDDRSQSLEDMPGLQPLVKQTDGKLAPKLAQSPQMIPASHHQKVAVFDDKVLYIGGLDVDRRRHDTPRHRIAPEKTWHDVQVIMTDPVRARAARQHLRRFETECDGKRIVVPPKGLLRTLSRKRPYEGVSMSPETADTGIFDRHVELIERSEHLIYLENQFLRDPQIADALVARAKAAPDVGLILMLPAAPQEVAFEGDEGMDQKYGEHLQVQCLNRLKQAFGDRLFIGSPAKPEKGEGNARDVLHGAPIVFIHSKVSVFDDFSALVTSANLNGRSMRWDTELGIEITHPEQQAHLRDRVMGAWLPRDADETMTAPVAETVERWRELAEANLAAAPEKRQGFVLPYNLERAADFGSPLPGIPVEMV